MVTRHAPRIINIQHYHIISMNVLALATIIFCIGSGSAITVYAETESPSGVISGILQSEFVQLSIVIVLIGVALRTWAGLIGKSWLDLNINRILFTFVISLLTSINIVMPILQNLDLEGSPELWFVALIGAILTVVGSDSISKAVVKQVKTTAK